MTDFNSLVPVVAKAATTVTSDISNLVTKVKVGGVIQRTQFEILKNQTAKVLADAKAYNTTSIITTNLEQIAKTQEYIDTLFKQGRLHGVSLNMAMEQLADLNDILRKNLRRFENT